ncbi:MAG: hypothetical protein H6577_12520 [Lewinellaceae bacterium]|nr:hypothetical protein [Lewinellaceae bacterium]
MHSLYVNDNDALTALGASFPKLASVSNNLYIAGNENLLTIDGFGSLASTGRNIEIENNPSLQSINGFASLDRIGGSLDIDSNPSLSSIGGMQALRRTGEVLYVRNLPLLGSLVFANVDTVGTELLVQSNQVLSSVSFPKLVVTDAGALRITSNASLTGIGFPELVRVSKNYTSGTFYDSRSLYVNDNDALTALDASFPKLASVSNNLYIAGNENLQLISTFDSLATIGRELNVSNNPNLSSCCGINPILLLESQNQIAIGGQTIIQNNKPGCNSPVEVVDTCANVVLDVWYRDNDGDGFGNINITTLSTSQPAGFVADNTDCNDNETTVFPGNPEVLDQLDNDCNGIVDDGFTVWFLDNDLDGFGDPTSFVQSTTQPAGYVDNNDDCDDNEAGINPSVTETCDGIDNNCDGEIDEGLLTAYYPDMDNDGFGDSNASPTIYCTNTQPNGFVDNASDCNDTDSTLTDDCSGTPIPCPTGDLIFTSQLQIDAFPTTCNIINGNLIINGDDITDLSNLLSIQQVTGSVIIGDTVQGMVGNDSLTNLEGLNNIETIGGSLIICQNPLLESLSGFSSLVEVTGNILVKNCEHVESFILIVLSQVGSNITLSGLPLLVEVGPFNFTIHSGNIVIDGTGLSGLGGFSGLIEIEGDLFIQNNPNLTQLDLQNLINLGGCLHIINNTLIVDLGGLDNIQTIGGDIRIIDNDSITNVDNLGSLTSVSGSLVISGNDLLENLDSLANLISVLDSLIISNNPNLSACCGLFPLLSGTLSPSVIIIENNLAGCNSEQEILITCNDPDGDSIPSADDNCPNVFNPQQEDDDNDGYGLACECDDTDANINPGATEACDGLDNNCNGQIDEGLLADFYPDADGDGFGDASAAPLQECAAPPGFVDNNGDCNDNEVSVNPSATETCDGQDNNCDGQVDEGLTFLDYYPDVDMDGFGDANTTATNACVQPPGTVDNNGDCDDSLATVNPNAVEDATDGIDNDCDGIVDNGSPVGCSSIGIDTLGGNLVITGLDLAPISFVQVFNSNWNTLFQCFDNCGSSLSLNVGNGTFYIFAKYFDSNYQEICSTLETVVIAGNGNPNPTDPCGNVVYQTSPNLLTITGLDPAYFPEVQLFDLDWDSIYYCFNNCGTPAAIPLAAGGYQILFKYFDQNYAVVCEQLDTVYISDNLIGHADQLQFEVVKHEEHVEIIWLHRGGKNIANYTLQKAGDDMQFENMEVLVPDEEAGYEFYTSYDISPAYGNNFYRLMMEYDDQTTGYSDIKNAYFQKLLSFTIFPNPANDFTKIDLADFQGKSAELRIVNTLGIPVKSFNLDNTWSRYFQMDIRELQEGYYFVWIFVDDHRPVTRPLMVGKR